MERERKIPLGRLARIARLVASGAKTGTGLFLSPKRAAELAAEAADTLGTLRGLATKVGQMASYVDGVVPEELRPAFERGMATLRSAAPTSSPAAIRAVVEEELRGPIDRLFARWDEQPFASASIGQVHAARLHDGREVAVKVQHPGIQRAIENDLDNAGTVESIVRTFGAGKLGSAQALVEIRQRFLEELDYVREAEQQRWFRAHHQSDADIVVPAVIDTHSGRRVLTSELVSGVQLDEVATQSAEARRRYAETLWRFVFRAAMLGGRFNADPHPGNFLFQPGARIAFVDFGCIQDIAEPRRQLACAMHQAAGARDEQGWRSAAKQFLGTQGGAYERFALDYTRFLFEPLFGSPFRMTRAYVREVVERTQSVKREVIFGKEARFVPLPPGTLFLNRLQFGFYSVLARLDVEVDYAGVERKLFAAAEAHSAASSPVTM